MAGDVLESLTAWYQARTPDLYEGDRVILTRRLANAVRRKDLASALVLGGEIAYDEMAVGTGKVLSGDDTGWDAIHRYGLVRTLQVQARTANFHVNGGATVFHLMCIQRQDLAEPLITLLHHDLFENPEAWGDTRTTRFALWLWSVSQGEAPGAQAHLEPDMGVYARIAEAWYNTAKLEALLPVVCNYHLEQADLTSREGPLEFVGYDLLPIELDAIHRARLKLGLETPKFKHPLLDTHLTPIRDFGNYGLRLHPELGALGKLAAEMGL